MHIDYIKLIRERVDRAGGCAQIPAGWGRDAIGHRGLGCHVGQQAARHLRTHGLRTFPVPFPTRQDLLVTVWDPQSYVGLSIEYGLEAAGTTGRLRVPKPHWDGDLGDVAERVRRLGWAPLTAGDLRDSIRCGKLGFRARESIQDQLARRGVRLFPRGSLPHNQLQLVILFDQSSECGYYLRHANQHLAYAEANSAA